MDLLKIILENRKDIEKLKRQIICCVSSTECPPISAEEGNTIVCNEDGIFSSGGAALTASNGIHIDGTDIKLGGDLTEATVITGNTNTETISFLGTTTGNFLTITNSDLTGKALHVEGDVRMIGPKVYVGNRTIEGTNENFFITAVLRSFREESTSVNPTLNTNLGIPQYLYLNDTASLSRILNVHSQNVINVRGAISITSGSNEVASHQFDTFFLRSSTATATSVVTANSSPTIPLTTALFAMRATNSGANVGPVTLNGWYTSIFTKFQFNSSAHTMQNYADIILGGTTYGSTALITNKYGLYINPIANVTFVTNAYAIYQNGASDINYFAGKSLFGGAFSSPSAYIHLGAGTATASTSPLKFTSGTNLTTAETGAVEYNGTNLFFTRTGTTRETVVTGITSSPPLASGSGVPPATFWGGSANWMGDPASWLDVVIAGTSYKIPLYNPS